MRHCLKAGQVLLLLSPLQRTEAWSPDLPWALFTS